MAGRPTGTVTFLFTDVEGSTRLWASDSTAMSASLLVHDELLRDSIESHGGVVFTTAGDSFAAAFQRTSEAVSAATVAQERLSGATWPGPALRVRMGLHLGEAEERGGDYFGPVVNTTARVEAAGHGGQVLITEAVRLASGVEAIELGSHRLRDIDEPITLHQLGTDVFPPLRVVDAARSNLPSRPTRLLGRDDDIERVRRLLANGRLVTVTAVGGIGKTRLAIAVGEAELVHRPDGVWFVDLTALSSGAAVAGAVANGIGLQLSGGDAAEQLISFLSDKDALVIIDNCEHVLDDVADLMEALLRSPGSACVLATSREALDVEGERSLVLRPLATDDADSPAVRLFLDRASAVDAGWDDDESSRAAIAQICERLDGMPLAIELAAARVAVMSLDDVLAGLDNRFQLLSGGRRRQRQRTLEATLDWSYDLLEGDEQSAFRSLGVFLDGFDIEAVAAVADISKGEATELVEALLAKSLVVRADRNGRVRFRLLETLKAYAEDRLVDSGEASDVRARHLGHYFAISMRNGRSVCGGTLGMGRRLRFDVSNVSAAIEHAMATGRLDTAAELLTASAMGYFLDIRLPEFAELLDRVLAGDAVAAQAAADRLDDDLIGCLRATRVWAHVFLANWNITSSESKLLQDSPDPLHRGLGSAIRAFLSGSSDAAEPLAAIAEAQLDEGAEQPRRSNVETMARWMLADARASHALRNGRTQDALDHAEKLLRTPPDTDDRGYSHVSVATVAATAQIMLGQPERAFDTIAWLSELDIGYYDAIEIRALAHLALGELDEARTAIRVHAARGVSGRLHGEAADSLLLLAELARAEGDDALARRLLADVGLARGHSTIRLAHELATELGIADECTALLRRDVAPDADRKVIASRTITATRSELGRRGWL